MYAILALHDAYAVLGRGFGAHRQILGSRHPPSGFRHNAVLQPCDAYSTVSYDMRLPIYAFSVPPPSCLRPDARLCSHRSPESPDRESASSRPHNHAIRALPVPYEHW